MVPVGNKANHSAETIVLLPFILNRTASLRYYSKLLVQIACSKHKKSCNILMCPYDLLNEKEFLMKL